MREFNSYPYTRTKGAKLYWEPRPADVRAGLTVAACALGRADDPESRPRAKRLYDALVAARAGQAARPDPGERTLRALVEDWRRRKKPDLAPKTQAFYEEHIRALLDRWADLPVAAIRRDAIVKHLAHVRTASGPHAASNRFATIRMLLTRAAGKGWLADNPTTGAKGKALLEDVFPTRKTRPKPGRRVATPAEISALVRAADAMGLPEAGDGVLMCLFLPHNPQDVVKVTVADVTDRWRSARGKTEMGFSLAVPPLLVGRLRERGVLDRTPAAPVLVSSRRAGPLTEQRLGQIFREVRAKAAELVPTVADLTLRDLRRTARSWAESGGATLAQSAALLAHSQDTAARHARAYSVVLNEVADAAQAALLGSSAGKELAGLLTVKEDENG